MSIPAGNKANGEKLFKGRCSQCHSVSAGTNGQGPSLHGIFGRTAGTVEGYTYSFANKSSGVVWSEETLFEYLLNPKKYIPKTKMNFPGFKNPQDRADVIEYLKSSTT